MGIGWVTVVAMHTSELFLSEASALVPPVSRPPC